MKSLFDFLSKIVGLVIFGVLSCWALYLVYFPITVPTTILILLLILIFG